MVLPPKTGPVEMLGSLEGRRSKMKKSRFLEEIVGGLREGEKPDRPG